MVERAYINDIAALTALRLEFLQEDCGELNEEVISKLVEALPAYFEKNLNHNIFCYLIREKVQMRDTICINPLVLRMMCQSIIV